MQINCYDIIYNDIVQSSKSDLHPWPGVELDHGKGN